MNEFDVTDCAVDITSDTESDISQEENDLFLLEDSLEEDFIKHVEEFDFPEEIKSVIDQNVQPLALPRSNGEWLGEAGNSEFVLDSDYIPSGRGVNSEGLTISEILKDYDVDGVTYQNKEPDFSPFIDSEIGAATLDSFSESRTGKDGTYSLASSKAAENLGVTSKEIDSMMEDRNLTWHECSDRKTVIPIPTDINAAFKHSGGISIEKGMNDLGDYLSDEYGHLSLSRGTPVDGSMEAELDIERMNKESRDRIKNHRNNKE